MHHRGIFTYRYDYGRHGVIERHVSDIFLLAPYIRVIEVWKHPHISYPSNDIVVTDDNTVVRQILIGELGRDYTIDPILAECSTILASRGTVIVESNCKKYIEIMIGLILRFLLERNPIFNLEIFDLCDSWLIYSKDISRDTLREIYKYTI